MKNEAGISLLETIAALALIGIIGVVFLGALSTSSNSRALADEHVTARILAESQMEYVRQLEYAADYDPAPDISSRYPGYTTDIDVESMRNGHIQKITITVSHRNADINVLESYKVRRTSESS